MAQIPALTPLRKQMATAANNVIDVNLETSTNYGYDWDTADCTSGYYATTTTTTTPYPYSNLTPYPYSNVGVVSSLTPPTLSVISETEIDKKINDALGKLDEHVDQLEGDIEFFNEERQKQEQRICNLENEITFIKSELADIHMLINSLRTTMDANHEEMQRRVTPLEEGFQELRSDYLTHKMQEEELK